MRLIRAVTLAEKADDFHLGRLLLLLDAAANIKSKTKLGTIEGITKLAKMDFLLRYPNCLERALVDVKADPAVANVKQYERTTIETKMYRFRYGPWDKRYRRWIGLLVSKGLATTFVTGNTVHVKLTEKGRSVAAELSGQHEFRDIKLRSDLIIKHFGAIPATKLKDFIYKVFPELASLKWGENINL